MKDGFTQFFVRTCENSESDFCLSFTYKILFVNLKSSVHRDVIFSLSSSHISLKSYFFERMRFQKATET